MRTLKYRNRTVSSHSGLLLQGRLGILALVASFATAFPTTPLIAQESFNQQPHLLSGSAAKVTLGDQGKSQSALRTNISKEIEQKFLSNLLGSNRQVVIQTLEHLGGLSPTESLAIQVKSLAESSQDSIVRGYARLLAADWQIPLTPQPIGLKLSDASGAYSGGNVERISVLDESKQATISLNVQEPFWATKASFDSSLPADVEVPKNQNGTNWTTQTLSDTTLAANSASPLLEARPEILSRPLDAPPDPILEASPANDTQELLRFEEDAPLGFTGASGVLPTETQQSSHFVPVEDRWRAGFSAWDRYGKGHPDQDDYPFQKGNLLDPYNQNVLKGDFPIIGQHTFYSITATNFSIYEFRQTPTATTPFESTRDAFSGGFFGDPNQIFYTPFLKLELDLFHGNEAFKPLDWKVRLTPVLNFNHLSVNELAVVNPDVRRGTTRNREDFSLQEWYIEAKLADIGPDYDFVSARVGSQLFVSDFRGFIFRDINRAVRLFGTRLANRDQFNLIWFDQAEKNTNSELNTFDDRHQNVFIANYFRQDFVFPGYTAQASFHYNNDQPSTQFDDNDVLVRPDPAGIFKEHQVDAFYLGFGGEGHIGRINVVNQLYFAFGTDSANPIGGTRQQIDAQMAALELSYDRDWIRFRTSYFFASGDSDPNDGRAEGFDTILDDPVFAGGEFSYWQRQSIRLFGTNLVQRKSIVPNLRSSKIQGQSNFVNPGLHLFNVGMDFELTPKLRVISNANYLLFDTTEVLEVFTFQNKIDRKIGADLSVGCEYRPRLNDNVIFSFGIATLIPDDGLKDLFGSRLPDAIANINVGDELANVTPDLTSAFCEMVLTY